MKKKNKDKDMIRLDRRDFIGDVTMVGGSVVLAGSLGITQVSCSKKPDQPSVVLSRPKPEEHIAACGIFCGNCSRLKSGKCQGCQIEPGYNCATRDCCIEKGITGCWQCDEFKAPADYKECPKINTFMSKVWKLIYKTDRPAALEILRDQGEEAFIESKKKSGQM